MEPDRRNQISDLYHAALARSPEERRAFLTHACNGDDVLRQEVESLLQFEPASVRFLETPAAAGLEAVAPARPSMLNRQLGPYTIVAPLGVGGMGEVYRARDSKLGRDVALKILPAQFTSDAERRARFAREARLLATLNHPHIGAIYGLEEADGLTALVLELVEGPTLADRLARGPLHLAEALTIARQVAEALEAAHEKGIVHRDLKPANIVLQGSSGSVSDVRAKVLDFGLAKALTGAGHGDATIGQDESLSGTADGRILGTPAYMSPEQARGQTVDKRTDIWAFGCVLFEMLAGRRAFEGSTVTDTLARILEREPEWTALPAETPASMRRLVERCLRKDPRKRLHDIADALIEIDDATHPGGVTGTSADVAAPAIPTNRHRLAWTAGGLVAGAVLTILSLPLVQRDPVSVPDDSNELALAAPPGSRFGKRGPILMPFALAPDGRQIAFTAFMGNGTSRLWVRPLGSSSEARQLAGTDGGVGPFWSPDSRQIAFLADGKLKTISVHGGPASEISDAPTPSNYRGGSWNQDNVIIFGSTAGPLYRVASAGGTPTAVTALQEGDSIHAWPWFLPDGQHFLFLALGSRRPQLRMGSLTSIDSVAVGAIESRAVYAAGNLLFMDDRGLMAQPFDPGSRRLSGEPMPLVERPAHASPFPQADVFSVSVHGRLAYRAAPLFETQLTWMDRKGNPVGTVSNPGAYANLSLSPDDRQLAVSGSGPDDGVDIWIVDLIRNDRKRLTTTSTNEYDPTWSPDGKFVIFASNRSGFLSLFRRPSDGSGSDALVAKGEVGRGYNAPEWSPDGKVVISNGNDRNLWIHSPDGESKASPFLATRFTEGSAAFSPDGRFVVYSSDHTGRPEIYVRPFPFEDRESKISRDGGRYPRWRIDTEIVFLSPDGTMMSARVSGGKPVPGTTPRPLFRTALGVGNQKPYDVSLDGQRFLIPIAGETDEPELITIITNWTTKLRK